MPKKVNFYELGVDKENTKNWCLETLYFRNKDVIKFFKCLSFTVIQFVALKFVKR